MASKRKRFNWKARQHSRGENRTSKRENGVFDKEGDTSSYIDAETMGSNSLVLPSKRKASQENKKLEDTAFKRSKMNPKERKRLKKIVEAKEKKARHAAVIASLQSLALPPSEMSLLQSSTSIAQNRVTAREATKFINERQHSKLGQADIIGQACILSGTSWRIKKGKRRKYKKLKAEKSLLSPKSSREEEAQDEEKLGRLEGVTEEEETMVTEEEEVEDDGDEDNEVIFDQDKEHQFAIINSQEKSTADQRIEDDSISDRNKAISVTSTPVVNGPADIQEVHLSLSEEKQIISIPAVYVPVNRPAYIQESRLALPILSEEQQIMEAISENSVVVICGETGSGKTTQVPQFLYEAGYTQKERDGRPCMVAVTQPRRIAAITMSGRVAEEMNLSSKEVSYQIRYEGTVSNTTKIKFMTDGVLLKEVENDLLLSRYSVVIIDEAHERSVFTDVLIGLLSRIVPLRKKKGYPLKLVIMSATLRVEDFTENRLLFPFAPPVVKVDSRQFPVTVHFNRTTPTDYVTAAFSKVCKIHRQLPEGHILVFLTGKAEIHTLCKQLRKRFPSKYQAMEQEVHSTDSAEEEELMKGRAKGVKRKRHTAHTKINLDDYPVLPEDEGEEDSDDLEEEEDEDDGQGDHKLPLLVLPLYSMLSTEQQAKVFQPSPAGVRLCVIATNVAETSITIPNIKFVVDSGKVKEKHYDKITGAYTFRVGWVSKASANQRAGRAGRTSPGHCYRLYSSAVFQHQFTMFSAPEITQRPVDDLVLQMKALHIDRVVNFPFPTPPSKETLVAAERLLVALGALHDSEGSAITPLGLTMAQFPIAPRYAKMLCIANQNGCLPYMIAIASALSVNEIFTISDSLKEDDEEMDEGSSQKQQSLKLAGIKRTWAGMGECQLLGDLMVLLRAVGAFECSVNKEAFCRRYCLRYKAMIEIRKLRKQLTNIINTVCSDVSVCIDPNMAPPTSTQARFLRQIVLTGLGDHIARKISTSNMNVDDKRKMRYAYESPMCESVVHLHPSSSLLNVCPQYVVFQELLETTKQYIRGVTAVEEEWFPSVLPHLCSFSQPLDLPPPSYDVDTGTLRCHRKCSFSSSSWPLEVQEVAYPDCLEKYKLFAQFFLQGKVVPSLSKYCPYLLSAPVTMMKTWAKLHKRTEVLLSALVAREVCSQQQLLTVWRKEPKYLLKAYSMWLPESKHSQIANNWPPCSLS